MTLQKILANVHRHFNTVKLMGINPDASYTRASWSDDSSDLMLHFHSEGRKMGLENEFDKVGNLYMHTGDNELFFSGSHPDTVVCGGQYDGLMGIIAATEAVRMILDSDLPMEHGIGVNLFRGEESDTFGVFAKGSRAAFGFSNSDVLKEKYNGVTLSDSVLLQEQYLRSLGVPVRIDLDAFSFGKPAMSPSLLRSFAGMIETHIEQGNFLEKNQDIIGICSSIREATRYTCEMNSEDGVSVAKVMVELDLLARENLSEGMDLVQTIGLLNANGDRYSECGKTKVSGYAHLTIDLPREKVEAAAKKIGEGYNVWMEVSGRGGQTIIDAHGEFDHSGATPMGQEFRKDANLAAAYFLVGLEGEYGPFTSTFNNPKGKNSFYLDIRSDNGFFKNKYTHAVELLLDKMGTKYKKTDDATPIETLDDGFQVSAREACETLGIPYRNMSSGAGHDVAIASRYERNGVPTRAGLFFIPCVGGKSHCGQEKINHLHVAQMVPVLANALYDAANPGANGEFLKVLKS